MSASITARNHPTPRYGCEPAARKSIFASTSRLVDAAAAAAFALHYRSPSRHRDVTAPLIARAAPRRRRSNPARLRLSVWAGLHNNSLPALERPGHEPKTASPNRRVALPRATRRPTGCRARAHAPNTPCRPHAARQLPVDAPRRQVIFGRLLLFMLVVAVVSQ